MEVRVSVFLQHEHPFLNAALDIRDPPFFHVRAPRGYRVRALSPPSGPSSVLTFSHLPSATIAARPPVFTCSGRPRARSIDRRSVWRSFGRASTLALMPPCSPCLPLEPRVKAAATLPAAAAAAAMRPPPEMWVVASLFAAEGTR